jgi:hypothetical protein
MDHVSRIHPGQARSLAWSLRLSQSTSLPSAKTLGYFLENMRDTIFTMPAELPQENARAGGGWVALELEWALRQPQRRYVAYQLFGNQKPIIDRSFSLKMVGQNSGGRIHPIWVPEAAARPCAPAGRRSKMGDLTLSGRILTARAVWRLKNGVKAVSDVANPHG